MFDVCQKAELKKSDLILFNDAHATCFHWPFRWNAAAFLQYVATTTTTTISATTSTASTTPFWVRCASSKFPFKCRSLSLALPSIMRHVALARPGPSPGPCPSQPHPQLHSLAVIGRVSVALAFNLCPRVASGSCLPKKAHTPSWEAPASTARRCAVSLQFANVNVIAHTLQWVAAVGYMRRKGWKEDKLLVYLFLIYI